MTTTYRPETNGHARKSLAAQIDRLDNLLDGLAEALEGAVTDAVKSAVTTAGREAVQAVMTEVLTNPDVANGLRILLTPAPVPTAEPVGERLRSWLARIWAKVSTVGRAVGDRLRASAQRGVDRARQLAVRAGETLTTLRMLGRLLRPLALPVMTAATVAVAVAVAAYHAGPALSAAISGASVFSATLVVQAGLWLRRMFASCLSRAVQPSDEAFS